MYVCVHVSDSLIVGGETGRGGRGVGPKGRGGRDFRKKIPDLVPRSRNQILGRAHSLFENRPLIDFQIRNGHVWRPAVPCMAIPYLKIDHWSILKFSNKEWPWIYTGPSWDLALEKQL